MLKTAALIASKSATGEYTLLMKVSKEERKIVEEITTWMGRCGEAIYGRRPWRLHGEGLAINVSGASSKGGQSSIYTAEVVGYVTCNGAVHALVVGWPKDRIVRLRVLGSGNPLGRGQVCCVSLPRSEVPLSFARSVEALQVREPDTGRNSIGLALVIKGTGLVT